MRNLIKGILCGLLISPVAIADDITQLDGSIDFRAVYWHGNQIWASGTAGSIYMSTDNGQHWQQVSAPQNTEQLEFRDIQALGDDSVLLMSAGAGDSSRIYSTTDNGNSWHQVSVAQSAKQFYDCFQMTDTQSGWLYGDADEKGLFVLETSDGGKHWQRVDMPISAQPNEGGFASSGTCVNRGNNNIKVIIGTGNSDKPRLLLRDASGWLSIDTPFNGGEASGVFSVQLSDDDIFAFGGSLKSLDKPAVGWKYNLSTKQWQALPKMPLNGAVYGSAIYQNGDNKQLWISNPNGVAVLNLADDKPVWQMRSKLNIWSLACRENLGCIGVGQQGTIQHFAAQPKPLPSH